MITKWKIDPTHSEIQFKVKHLMITTITGSFTSYNLLVETEDSDFTKATKINFTADADSISTGNEQRDGHLKSAEFFDAARFKVITFKGTKAEKSGDEYQLHGDLTIKDVTRPVTLKVEHGGTVVDPYNQTKTGFSVTGKISRKEFGLTWDAVTETGSIVVGDEVKINCEIQLIKVE
jgi:polyisoprenoid-binding protein YceI